MVVVVVVGGVVVVVVWPTELQTEIISTSQTKCGSIHTEKREGPLNNSNAPEEAPV